jgi:2',3'-cyclic-nucleotide 2'-phosphodiesterase
MLKIIHIGDINGKIGRKAVVRILPKLKKELKPDLVIANAENAAHGSGITETVIKELMDAGVNYFTTGDHAFDRPKQLDVYDKYPIIRPANFPPDNPGTGFTIITIKDKKILLVNLLGRVFMHLDYDCPFRKIDEILANSSLPKDSFSAIIIDIHAEATSEKAAMGHYLNGRVSAVLGTHTHTMTADEKILSKGTAFITDVGMVGAYDSCLGVDFTDIVKTFLTQVKYPHIIPEKGIAIFNAVMITVDTKNAIAKSIKSIIKKVNIT